MRFILTLLYFSPLYFSVIELYWCVHENFQPNLYDAFDWPLVWLSPVSRTNAAGLSKRLLGYHQ